MLLCIESIYILPRTRGLDLGKYNLHVNQPTTLMALYERTKSLTM
jgi:hypothetical protein